MKITQKTHDISEYLKSDEIIDYDDKSVSRLADTLYERSEDSLDYIRNVYEYVRDRIPHSADINAEGVSCSASEVLKIGHGICFAKSHLLAALLRYKGIPTGFCYQKLILDDETPSFAISLYRDYRGQGIGTKLMKEMLAFLKEKGYKRASLAVQKANYAVKMYQNVGFKTVDENAEEYIMVCEL